MINIEELILKCITEDEAIKELATTLKLRTDKIMVYDGISIEGVAYAISFINENTGAPAFIIPIFNIFDTTVENYEDYIKILIEYELTYYKILKDNNKLSYVIDEVVNEVAFQNGEVEYLDKKNKEELNNIQLMTLLFIAKNMYQDHFRKDYEETLAPEDVAIIKQIYEKQAIEDDATKEKVKGYMNNIIVLMAAEISK